MAFQPTLNAALNSLATLLLVSGLIAIRRGNRRGHERFMIAALCASAAFLASYLHYHFTVEEPTRFRGAGAARTAYFALLVSHTVLAVVNLPMVLRTFHLARRERWTDHRRWAKWTFPIWLYVSVTGVTVYLVLYHFNPPAVVS
jgi:uncharacterized membrane protein YozB (DUF420 family)